MAKQLFGNFLSDSVEYDKAASTWRARWDALVRAAGQEALWQVPWINNEFANGGPCRDGNPIFSAVSPSRGIGVRVIQEEPANGEPAFTSWTDTFDESAPDSVMELVISCALTDATLERALNAMKKWIHEAQKK